MLLFVVVVAQILSMSEGGEEFWDSNPNDKPKTDFLDKQSQVEAP